MFLILRLFEGVSVIMTITAIRSALLAAPLLAGPFLIDSSALAQTEMDVGGLPAPVFDLLAAATETESVDRFEDAVRLIALTQRSEDILAAAAELGWEGEARAALGVGPAPVSADLPAVAEVDYELMARPEPREAPADDPEADWWQAPVVLTTAVAETVIEGESDLWNGRIEGGLRFDSGNTDRQDYIVGAEVTRELSGWGFNARLDYAYSEIDGTVGQDLFRIASRGEREAGERYTGYVSADYERDAPASYDWTAFVGGGVGYRALRSALQTLILRAGPGVRLLDEPGYDTTLPALELGADYALQVTESIQFTSETGVLISEIGRADQRFALNSALNDVWSVELKYHYRNEFDPEPGFASEDHRTDVSLVRSF